MADPIYENLTQLGGKAQIPASPDEAVLEKVTNPQAGTDYLIRFTCPEFTSLCPITGHPDFAHLVIDSVPDALIVESKSLKLFLSSFRNQGAFHEDCTVGHAQCAARRGSAPAGRGLHVPDLHRIQQGLSEPFVQGQGNIGRDAVDHA